MSKHPTPAAIEEAVLSFALEVESDDDRKVVSFEECDEVAAQVGCHASCITRGLRALGFETVR